MLLILTLVILILRSPSVGYYGYQLVTCIPIIHYLYTHRLISIIPSIVTCIHYWLILVTVVPSPHAQAALGAPGRGADSSSMRQSDGTRRNGAAAALRCGRLRPEPVLTVINSYELLLISSY